MSDTNATCEMRGDSVWYRSGALWAAVLLIVLPIALLFSYMNTLAAEKLVGLPILAILGICILFGAVALVAVIFAQFKLSDTTQALALPEGSIRATIALSLIVLFAIIAIMLHQSSIKTDQYLTDVLTSDEKKRFVDDNGARVIAVLPSACLGSTVAKPDAAKEDAKAQPVKGEIVKDGVKGQAAQDTSNPVGPEKQCYKVRLRVPPDSASADLAKQLLVLVGTLMTAVTSFYFAAHGTIRGAPGTDGSSRTPSPRAISPSSIKLNGERQNIELSVTGSDLESVVDVRLEQGGASIKASKVLSNKDRIEFTIPVNEKTAEGDWTVVALDGSGKRSVVPEVLHLTK